MGYTNLDKLLNVILKLKYDWISKIDIPYHYTNNDRDTYYIHIYINQHILKIIDHDKFPKGKYKIPINSFEKETKVNFNFLIKDIDNLFYNQMLTGRFDFDIWFFIPENLR